jgi:hypothetical protein
MTNPRFGLQSHFSNDTLMAGVNRGMRVRELLAAVQMTVPLQEWRLAHGGYPATLPFSPASARYNLSYRPSADRHGYQLVSRAGAIVLDVNDGASPASRRSAERVQHH